MKNGLTEIFVLCQPVMVGYAVLLLVSIGFSASSAPMVDSFRFIASRCFCFLLFTFLWHLVQQYFTLFLVVEKTVPQFSQVQSRRLSSAASCRWYFD